MHISAYRYYGHFEGDAATYRPEGEAEKMQKDKDCLMIFRNKALATKLVTDKELDDNGAAGYPLAR